MRAAQGPVICFDLGGVLARIRRTWGACAEAAGVALAGPSQELSTCAAFDDYQHGLIEDHEYLGLLGTFLGVDLAASLRIHDAILDRPYEGTLELIEELQTKGLATACLSNTNALHWRTLDSPTFEAIRRLDLKLTSHDTKLLKPDPKMFEAFERFAALTGPEIVYFDDDGDNVAASLERGWRGTPIDPESDPAGQIRAALASFRLLDR